MQQRTLESLEAVPDEMAEIEKRPASAGSEPSVVPSTCWECGAICGSLLTIQNGKVLKIAPNPSHPASKGAFCVKGIRAAHEWTYQSTRLRQPRWWSSRELLVVLPARSPLSAEPVSCAASLPYDRFH